ncbi:sodium:solute symporter family protein [Pontibacter akesuensis]|uniref:Na+/proline symporter n=1 Tax=Pontibacter akesuensis TaxID=388950 RepID=A0A1I7FNT1_9BACT|nr:sodium:solute symporter family protein [Pontibacter akesuensis]GHA61255.1 sodium:proline symporter [Pontibacter akesuensis]SFU37862.1 Na+/proline symporter [Pontibacter akesuensis]
MHLDLIDWIVIGAFGLLTLVIGLSYTGKASGSMANFFLGGRNLTWWVAGTSMVATTFAADTPLAVTELVAQSGISGNWLWWNMLLGGLLTTFFFARLWRRAGIITDLEFIEMRYSGKPASFLRGFRAIYLGIFMNSLIIGWVNVALMSIIEVFFEVPKSEQLVYVGLAMLVVVAYSSMSGLLGVAITDVIQFVIAMVGCIILAVLVVNSEQIGGIGGLKDKLPAATLDYFPNVSSGSEIGQTLTLSLGAFLAFTTVQWWASWYPGNEPGGGGYIAQRMMSTKNEKHALYATLLFQIGHYCIRPWPWILVALSALVLYPNLGAGEERLGFVMAMKDFLPPGLKGLLLVAFFAAYMSTISTQLNWGASYIINDFYGRFIKPNASQKELVSASRVTTLLLMIVSLAVTTQITSIAAVWAFIMETGAGLGLVLILRWYWWRINAWSEIMATIAPFVGYSVAKFILGWEFPDSFFLTVGFTTIVWIVATYATRPTPESKLQAFYEKIQPDGAWAPVRKSLGLPKPRTKVYHLLVAWISAVVMVYSTLFFIGDLIFQNYERFALFFGTALLGLFMMLLMSKKVKFFQD